MVLRAWLEGGRPEDLRVRVLSTVGQNQATPIAVSTVEAVHEAVRNWLDELRNSPDDVSVTPR
jgi:hypothetical protein